MNEHKRPSRWRSLLKRAPLTLTVLLLVQTLLVQNVSLGVDVPLAGPLTALPRTLGSWEIKREQEVDPPVQEVLRADATLVRDYGRRTPAGGQLANLFVAYFQSQRTGVSPHSPKNCLPGSGWTMEASGELSLEIPGRSAPLVVNRYIVGKGEIKSLVLYWYQAHHRVIASEYEAKLFQVWDAMWHRRSNTALVRVTVYLNPDAEEGAAEEAAIDFVRHLFGPLSRLLPS